MPPPRRGALGLCVLVLVAVSACSAQSDEPAATSGTDATTSTMADPPQEPRFCDIYSEIVRERVDFEGLPFEESLAITSLQVDRYLAAVEASPPEIADSVEVMAEGVALMADLAERAGSFDEDDLFEVASPSEAAFIAEIGAAEIDPGEVVREWAQVNCE